MRKLYFTFVATLGFICAALAQNNFNMPPPGGVAVIGVQVVPTCGAGSLSTSTPGFVAMDQTGKLCTNASGGSFTGNITQVGGVNVSPIASSIPLPIDCNSASNTLCGLIAAPIPAGPNLIGSVSAIGILATSGGWTPKLLAGLNATPVVIKATPGQLGKVYCGNTNASIGYIQTFNTTPITVGVTAPLQSYMIPASSSAGYVMDHLGDQYSNSIAAAATTTATGATSISLDCNASFN